MLQKHRTFIIGSTVTLVFTILTIAVFTVVLASLIPFRNNISRASLLLRLRGNILLKDEILTCSGMFRMSFDGEL